MLLTCPIPNVDCLACSWPRAVYHSTISKLVLLKINLNFFIRQQEDAGTGSGEGFDFFPSRTERSRDK